MVTLAHHWLVTYRGGEKVLGEFRKIFPTADMATLVMRRGDIPDWIIGSRVRTSWLQNVPSSADRYKLLLPFYPSAFGRLSVAPGTRLVLSSDAAMVKGLRMPKGCRQVCYCHSPPRYLWDMAQEYASNSSNLGITGRVLFRLVVPYVRRFDALAARRVGAFIANSNFVAQRIARYYGRRSVVIYPPVAVEDFSPAAPPGDFYLVVSQLVPYKRVDIAVKAFTAMGKKLVVIGEGSEIETLRAMAGPTVQILGKQPFSVVKEKFETCRAFINPQIEDFGITAVEAQAAGRPVIAFRGGGALETVSDGITGVFFDAQTEDSLMHAVKRFEATGRDWIDSCRSYALGFSAGHFRREIDAFLRNYAPDVMASEARSLADCK